MKPNERGNEVYRDEEADEKLGIEPPPPEDCDRYFYDEALRGWKQYDTKQDAWYFGLWVNVPERKTFTYAEGDRILVICPSLASFQAELSDAAVFYGPPPPAFVAYDRDGTRTEVYDTRPTGQEEGDK